MPRPQSKEALQNLSQENFNKLNNFIDNLSIEQRKAEFKTDTMNRNIRDVLAHLHHWHLMMLDWYKVGMAGQKPVIPSPGYTWKTVPDLNRKIWTMYQSAELEKIRKLFKSSHNDLQEIIDQHTNDELFEKKKYPWTGTTSLGAYLISATSSHYDWALKLIRKGLK